MPVQTQQSSLAKKLGGRLAEVSAECSGKPLAIGPQRLPGGITNGIAKVVMLMWKEQDKDGGKVPKGQTYFFGRAIALSPLEHNGVKVAGEATLQNIPLCDVPAKGKGKASTFRDNWDKFRSLIEMMGIAPCPENKQTDPTGVKTEAYFLAAMQTLTNPARPVYIKFTTKEIPGEKTPLSPNPEPYIYEQWIGLAEWNDQHDPAAGVNEVGNNQPHPHERPPSGAATTHTASEPTPPADPADEVAMLVEVAMNDPEGATEEGAMASARLEELAWEAGWSKEQTGEAPDWSAVGAMVLNPPTSDPTSLATYAGTVEVTGNGRAPVTVGSRWKFAKRDARGERLKNNKNEEFPPQDVEVTTVDEGGKLCTVKTVRDGKDVVDIRSKKPIAVRFEWLE